MNKTYEYLINLFLKSVNDNFYFNEDIEDVDFEKILKVSSINRISNCIYYGLLKLDKETIDKIPNLESFKKECLIYGIKEKVQENDILDIIKAFEKENIDMLFFKGFVLKSIYPLKDMRVMGDIDFLVNEKDVEKASKVLESIGFKKDENTDFNVEIGYKRNIEVELHKKLAVSEKKYFNDAWNHKEKFLDYSNTYTLDINYHFIYLLDHAFHHMKKGGLGMKYPMDFYLYLNKYDLNLNEIKDILKELKLEKFLKLIILLCHKWFKLPLDKYNEFISDFKVTNEELEVFEMFILSGGEYGLNRDIYTVQSVSQGNKFKYLLSKIFRPFRFVVKTDHPKWWQYTLLPIYYIKYWFSFFVIKGSKNIKKAKAYINSEDDNDLKNLFNKISK